MTGAEAVYLRGKGLTQADADMILDLIEDRRRRRAAERERRANDSKGCGRSAHSAGGLIVGETLKGGLGKALEEALLPAEQVQVCLEGLPGQAIVLTERRMIVIKAGLASGAKFGRKAQSFRLEDIT